MSTSHGSPASRVLRAIAVTSSIGLGAAVVIHAQQGCGGEAPARDAAATPAQAAAVEPAKVEPAKVEPTKVEPAVEPAVDPTKVEPAVDPSSEAKVDPPPGIAAPADGGGKNSERFFPASKSGIDFKIRQDPEPEPEPTPTKKQAPKQQRVDPVQNANPAPNQVGR